MDEQREAEEMERVLRSKGYYTVHLDGGVVFITQDRYLVTNPDPADTKAMTVPAEQLRQVEARRFTDEEREERVKRAEAELPPVDLEELASDAGKRFQWFWANARVMPLHQATVVRRLRCEEKLSWRGVARRFQETYFTAGWYEPATNQLAGMALCKTAAEKLGEDWVQDPWN